MKDLLPVITVFISGFFGLIVAYFTIKLTKNKDEQRYQKELSEKKYKETENRYVRIISAINTSVKYVRIGKERTDLSEEFSLLVAETTLLDDEEFNNKFVEVDNALSSWAVKHHLASPKKLGDTSFVVVSTADDMHKPEAVKLHQQFHQEMFEFIQMMKNRLNNQRN